MSKTAQKQHEKKKYRTGVYGPDGVFYSTGQQGDVVLTKCYNDRGKDIGMFWCHKNGELSWRKHKNDEVREEVTK